MLPSNDEIESRLRAHIHRILARGDIQQNELVARTTYSQPHISNVLRGYRRMPPAVAHQLAIATRTTIADLFSARELAELARQVDPD